MAWIESHSVLADHRKVRECASILGVKKVHLIGHLHCLWHKVIELAEDGNISDWTAEDIAYYAQWDGDPQKFFDALNGRFIDERSRMRNEAGLKNVNRSTRKITVRVIHDWLDYSWKYLYRKYHTSNPKRLEDIKNLYLYIGDSLGKPKKTTKSKPQVVLPNQPNQPIKPCEPTVHESSEGKTTSPHQTVIRHFFETVKREKGFEPKVDGGDGEATKDILKKHDVEILCDMINFYVKSEKAKEKGITLKAIFSTHSVNVYLENKSNKQSTHSSVPPGSPQLEMVKKFREGKGLVNG